jgi:hypothetical protein
MTAMRTRVRGSLRSSAAVVAAAAAVLIGMHLAVGAVLIAGFSRSTPA